MLYPGSFGRGPKVPPRVGQCRRNELSSYLDIICDVQVIHAAIFYGEIFPDGSRGFER